MEPGGRWNIDIKIFMYMCKCRYKVVCVCKTVIYFVAGVKMIIHICIHNSIVRNSSVETEEIEFYSKVRNWIVNYKIERKMFEFLKNVFYECSTPNYHGWELKQGYGWTYVDWPSVYHSQNHYQGYIAGATRDYLFDWIVLL